jgi:sortase A
VIRRLGTLIILVGLGLLAWSATVYLWKDPFTTAYTAWEQRRLEESFDRRVETWRERYPPSVDPSPAPVKPADVRGEARAYRRASQSGDAVARIEIPRLSLDVVVVNGTDSDELRRGPGRHLETFMPGERELVYIAGHRTTYGAPFSDIDDLERGDRVTVELPYATFEYEVTGHRIVDQYELSVLRTQGREELALQACHPRFFASQRYIVYARPVRVTATEPASAG